MKRNFAKNSNKIKIQRNKNEYCALKKEKKI